MKLAISNIAWTAQEDEAVYAMMRQYGYTGLEIAPTRFFATDPYEDLRRVADWRAEFAASTGFDIPSMQSIWFGRTESFCRCTAETDTACVYQKGG